MARKTIFLLFALVAVAACTRPVGRRKPVTVEKVWVEYRAAPLRLEARLEPKQRAEIALPLDVRIQGVPVQIGDRVAAGTPLIVLDESDFTPQLAKLRGEMMEKEAILEKNRYFLQNRDRLLEERKIDQTLYDTIEPEVKSLEGKVEILKAEIERVANFAENTVITAPFEGIISERNIASASFAKRGEKLLTLVQTDPLSVVFQVEPERSGGLASGLPVEVTLESDPQSRHPATVVFVSPEIDPVTRKIEARALLPNPDQRFKAGQDATVSFTSPEKQKVLSVPTKAIRKEGGKEFVYVVEENKAFRKRVFTKETSNPHLTEVTEGLKGQEIVVTEGYEGLKNGDEVDLWR